METLKAILTRRSIRKYTGEPVSEEMIRKMLEAGMAAPSANNQQPWQFVVITDRKLLNAVPKFHEYAQMLKGAPCAILVCGEDPDKHLYWQQDCAAAVQNILLAAHGLGLGAVWLGIYPREPRVKEMEKLLNLPGTVVPMALISIGHPAEDKPPANRFTEERTHRNQW